MSLKHIASLEEFSSPGVEYTQPVLAGGEVQISHPSEAIDHLVTQEAILKQIGDHEDAAVAVEAYMELLKAHAITGVSAQTAHAITIGLEQYRTVLGEGPLMPSLEAFGGTASRKTTTQVSLESLSDYAKAIGSKLRELFNQLMAWAKDFYAAITQDAEKLADKVRELKTQLSSITGERKVEEVRISNPSALSVNGDYKGADPTLIAGLVTYLSTVYPNQAGNFVKGVAQVVRQAANGMDAADIEGALSAVVSPEILFVQAGLGRSTFPGDVHLNFKVSTEQGYAKFMKQHLEMIKGQSKPIKEATVKVSDPGQLSRRCDQLLLVINNLIKAKDTSRGMAANAEALIGAANELSSALENNRLQGEHVAPAEQLLKATTALPKMLGPALAPVITYCYKTLAAMVAVLNHEIKAYGKA